MGVRRKFTNTALVNEAWSRPGAPDAAPTPSIFDPVSFDVLLGTAPFPVNTIIFNGVDQPTMAPLSSGGFVVVWMDGTSIWAQRFDSEGERFGAAIAVNALTHGPQGQQSVAGLASGGFVVSWTGLDGSSGLGIWARTFDANGQPVTGDVLLNTEMVGNEQQPVLAALSTGGFLASWADSNGDASGYGIKAQIFDALGAKLGGELLVNTTTALNQTFPRSAGLPGGGFVIAWTSAGPTEVRAQVFDAAGTKVGSEILVNAGPGEKSFEAVTVLASGNFVIAWADKLGDVDVKGQMFTAAGVPISTEFTISTTEAGNQDTPSLAALPDGGFVATWRDATGVGNYADDGEIKAQFFDATGARVGGEFLINVDTQGGQTLPQAASFGSGDLAFVWMDYAQGAVMARTFYSAILGTNGDDSFPGTADRDFYLGLDGNDVIGGGAGRDYLIGGAGHDTIDGGADADVLIGETGDDNLDGGDGNDEIDGGDGNDSLDGGAGDDNLHGGEGNDIIEAGVGRDSLNGDEGNDTLTATGGNDVWFFGGLGDDTLTASNGLFRMFGDEGGSSSDDGNDHISLTNGATGSWLDGGGGDDVLSASGVGQLTIGGGTGNNDITVQGFTHGSVVLLGDDDIVRLPAGFMNVTSFGGRDTIIINAIGAGFMTIIGLNAGEEGDRFDLSIYGANPFGDGTLVFSVNGPDTIVDHPVTGMRYVLQTIRVANLSAYNLGVPNPLYAPQDMVLNDAFADSPTVEWDGELVGADGNDIIRGYGGNDRLLGAGGNDRLEGGAGADFLKGGSGIDTASYEGDAGAIFVNLRTGFGFGSNAQGDTYNGIENLIGSSAADFLIGDDGVNRIDGSGGDDILLGGLGGDVLVGGSGSDTASYEDNWGPVFVNLRSGLGFGNAAQGDSYQSIENLTGGLFNDFFIGDDNVNRIDGGGGDDILLGGLGGDVLIGGTGSNTASYEDNWGAVFVNLSTGQGFNNAAEGDSYTQIQNLQGGLFNDFFIGDANANRLAGGSGNDTLIGAGGADIFVFDSALGAGVLGTGNVDTIADFVSGSDKIALSQAVFAGLPLGALAPGAFVVGTAAGDADDRIIYNQATGALLFDADGNGAGAAVQFATLQGSPALNAGDFAVI